MQFSIREKVFDTLMYFVNFDDHEVKHKALTGIGQYMYNMFPCHRTTSYNKKNMYLLLGSCYGVQFLNCDRSWQLHSTYLAKCDSISLSSCRLLLCATLRLHVTETITWYLPRVINATWRRWNCSRKITGNIISYCYNVSKTHFRFFPSVSCSIHVYLMSFNTLRFERMLEYDLTFFLINFCYDYNAGEWL